MRLGIYYFLYALAWVLLWPLSLLHRKLRQGLWARFGLTRRIRSQTADWPAAPRYWFHFSSSGEFEQCLPVLEELKRAKPTAKIFISCFSPSGRKAVRLEEGRRGNSPLPWDGFDYAPLDLPIFYGPLLAALRPQALIFINRELWPGLVDGCRRRQIPVYLIASFFSGSTQNKNRRLAPVVKQLTAAGTVDLASSQYLQSLAPALKVRKIGDPRVERVLNRKQTSAATLRSAEAFFPPPVLLFASLRPKDLAALAPGFGLLGQSPLSPRLVLVPHDPRPAEVEACRQALTNFGLKPRLWSHWLRAPDENSPLIVDTVGMLAELYRIATLVFVGGSFNRRVHNVLEPAAYGRPIFCGPLIENSREALELRERQGLYSYADGTELIQAMEALLRDPEEQARRAKVLADYLSEDVGAAKRYVDLILQ